jgi:uncharacterized membrane protein YiaA
MQLKPITANQNCDNYSFASGCIIVGLYASELAIINKGLYFGLCVCISFHAFKDVITTVASAKNALLI